MTLRLLLDEDCSARILVAMLRAQGWDVRTVRDAGLAGQDDETILQEAARDGRTLVTRNAGDFRQLHERNAGHCGILAIYQDVDPAKAMRYADIVTAIAHLEANGWEVKGQFVVLNVWRRPRP